MMIKRFIISAIVVTMVVMSIVVVVNIPGFALGQNKSTNMSKTGGNITSVLNKTSFVGSNNPTMAGKIANATKSNVPGMSTKTITSGLGNLSKTISKTMNTTIIPQAK